jgi:hypothetical protein
VGLDPKISHAISEAVANLRQGPKLANRLIAWVEAVNTGSANVNDHSDADRRLELLFASAEVDGDSEVMF